MTGVQSEMGRVPRGARRSAWGRAALLVACVFLACGPDGHPGEGAGVDRIVLVTIDTLRADHVGCYGSDSAHTPTLDGLARAGIRFDQAISPAPLTLPSHASLMTGLDPPSHGVRDNARSPLASDVPLLAERLRDRGLATGAFVGAAVLDPRFGLDRGFDVYDADLGFRRASGAAFAFPERRADRVIDSALAWLDAAGDRFFVWVHLYDPHADYDPPAGFAMAMPDDPYAAEIAFADAQLGRLKERVDADWPAGGTLWVVTSDHGESLGEHGESTHAYTLYDATQRVPLVMAGAGLPAGRVVDGVVRLIDVAPTILAIAGAEALPDVDGRDLAETWNEGGAEPRAAHVETLATQIDMGWSPLLGVRTDRWKYVRAPRPELYDLEDDPRELRNLADLLPDEVARLDRAVEAALARTRHGAPMDLDPALKDRLESLGYVVEDAPLAPGDLGRVGGPDPKDHLSSVEALNRAAVWLAEGRSDEVLSLLDEVDTDAPRAWRLRGRAALTSRRLDLARRSADALARQGVVGEAFVIRGNASMIEGDLAAAESAFRVGLEHDPDRPALWLGLARLSGRRGDRAEEEFAYRSLIERAPEAIEPRWRLAALLIASGRTEEGRAWLDGLPETELRKPAVAASIARAELEAGDRESAIARLESASAARPDHLDLHRILARSLAHDGRWADSIPHREAIVRLSPGDPAAKNDLAWHLAMAERDLDRALAMARAAIATGGGTAAFLDTLATVHWLRGEPALALEATRRAEALGGPDDAHLWFVRASALAELGRVDDARRALARSRAARGSHEPSWSDRADALARSLGGEAPAARPPGAG